jgi:hypothetical protein
VTAPVLIGAAAVATAVVIFSFRDQIADAFRGLVDLIGNPESGLIASVGGGWNIMMDGISSYVSNILPNISDNFAAFFDTIIGPENGLIARLGQTWNAGMDAMRDYALGLVEPITAAWDGIVNSLRGSLNGLLSWGANGVNRFIDIVNSAIARINSVSSRVGITAQPIQYVEVPQFAVGGRVERPTLIMAGEAGPEYIVPQKKVPQFIAAQMGDPGLGIRQGAAAGGGSRGGTFAPTFNLNHTGPVYRLPDGSDAITMADAVAIAEDAANRMWTYAQTPDGRSDLGIFR